MTQSRRVGFLGLVAALAVVEVLAAASQGRIFGTVLDPDGKPVNGVKVTVRALEVDVEEARTTNAKGKFTIVLLDATRSFMIRLEKEGYQAVELPVRPKIGDVLRQTWTLTPVDSPVAPPVPTAEPTAPKDLAAGRLARLYQDGIEALEKDNLNQAIEKFKMVLAESPEIAEAHTGLALAFLKKGEPEQAVVSADRALELTPDQILAARVRLEAYRELGDSDGEAAALEALAEIDPSPATARAVFNSGIPFVQAGDFEGAAQRFERSLELDPNLAPAYAALATIYLNLQSYDKAIANAEKHLELEPDSPKTLGVLYLAHRSQGDAVKAEEAWVALRATGSDFVGEEFLDYGVNYFNAGKIEEARLIFERILEMQPDHGLANYYSGLCLLSLGETDRAKELLERFVELEPDHPEAATAREMLATL